MSINRSLSSFNSNLRSGGDRLERIDVFKDISKRTNGDIYLGIVGAVRTGKSTFIKKFMELVVLPNIEDESERVRARSEEHTSELQSRGHLVCRLLLEKKK